MPDFEVGPEGRRPQANPLRRLTSILGGMLVWPLIVLAMAGAPSCMGFGDPALAAINACPAATAVLGSPVSQSWMGISCGNAETEDDDGRASWRMPVAGPSGSGVLRIEGAERGGRWSFGSLVLEAGSRTIDVLACDSGGTGEMIAIAHRDLTATVTTVVGEPGVASGATCTVTIDPADGGQNCRIGIACGTTQLYGGGTQGYGHCGADATGAITMRDANASAADGDPMLDVRTAQHEIVITDQDTRGTWVVTLTTE